METHKDYWKVTIIDSLQDNGENRETHNRVLKSGLNKFLEHYNAEYIYFEVEQLSKEEFEETEKWKK